VVKTELDNFGIPKKITFYGAGWGHGVGLCQIGAAIMAEKGFEAEGILKHYFNDAKIEKKY
jgi:SpoIID/LytB domain protein